MEKPSKKSTRVLVDREYGFVKTDDGVRKYVDKKMMNYMKADVLY